MSFIVIKLFRLMYKNKFYRNAKRIEGVACLLQKVLMFIGADW